MVEPCRTGSGDVGNVIFNDFLHTHGDISLFVETAGAERLLGNLKIRKPNFLINKKLGIHCVKL